jgi:hypothetical protein
MSRITAPMAAPTWGQIPAYTSDTHVALSMNIRQQTERADDGQPYAHGDE